MSVFVFKWCNFFAPTSEIYFTIWWKTLHHAKVAKTTVLYGFFGVFGSCSLSSYISIQTFYLLTFGWKKKKQMPRVTATGICERTDCKKVMTEFCKNTPEHAASWYHGNNFAFCFCSCMWREDSKHAEGFFFFHELPAICHEKDLCVFFIADRSVKRSVLVCWLFRRQSKKEERTVVRSFRVWVYKEVSSRFLKRSRSSTRCR